MPIYAFTCTACGHDYDRLQKLSDPDPIACPQCGAEAVKRQLTAPSFRLSGSGWYETDFKKDGKRNLTEKAEGSTATVTPAAASKSEPKAESKPAAKSEPAPKPAAGAS